jgi:hypothetical protein
MNMIQLEVKRKVNRVPLSWVWKHYKIITVDKGVCKETKKWADESAACIISYEKAIASTQKALKWAVGYGASKSAGHLERHITHFHQFLITAINTANAKAANIEGPMNQHTKYNSLFQEKYLDWIVAKGRELDTCEGIELLVSYGA